jgi:polyhydroxyalkanoate synthesis regulator phasin
MIKNRIVTNLPIILPEGKMIDMNILEKESEITELEEKVSNLEEEIQTLKDKLSDFE